MGVLQKGVIADQVLLLALYLFLPVVLSHLPSEPVHEYQSNSIVGEYGRSLVKVSLFQLYAFE